MSSTIIYKGIAVKVYRWDRNDWRIVIGTAVYSGYKTKTEAVAGISKFI